MSALLAEVPGQVVRNRWLGWLRVVVVSVPAVLLLAWHAKQYWPFMADDAFISLRYSDRLLHGQGLTWSSGPRVEGYTNLLWVLLCAALGLVMDLVHAARVLAFGTAATVLLALTFQARRGVWAAVACGAVASGLALSGPLAVWSVGGLEQPLLVACLSVAAVSLWRAAEAPEELARLWLPGFALALAVLTRPDSPLFVGCAALQVLATHGPRRWSAALRLLALPVLAFVAQLGFRLAYYGEWVPNTARLKTTLSWMRVEGGWAYVTDGLWVLSPFLVGALLGTLVLLFSPRRRWMVFTLVSSALWLGYVVTVGGDIFPGRRHLLAPLVLLALHTALGVWTLLEAGRGKRVLGLVGVVVFLAGAARVGLKDQRSLDAKGERWEWIAQTTGPFLSRAFEAEQPTVGIDAAGALGFFMKLPAIDMLALNDHDLPRRLPPHYGNSDLSHALHDVGNPDSILERKPALIVPCTPQGFASACTFIPWTSRLFAHPDFQANYGPMVFVAEGPEVVEGTGWLRRDSAIARVAEGETLRLKPASLAHDGGKLRFKGTELVAELAAKASVEVRVEHSRATAAEVDALSPGVAAVVAAEGDGVRVLVKNETEGPIAVRGVTLR